MGIDEDIYQLLYSSLIDSIRSRQMSIKQTRLLVNGCWRIVVEYKGGNGWCYYKFLYNDKTKELLLRRRKYFCYSDIMCFTVSDVQEVSNVAEKAVEAAFK